MIEKLLNLIANDFALVIKLGLTYTILSNKPLAPKSSCFVFLIINYTANSLSLSLSSLLGFASLLPELSCKLTVYDCVYKVSLSVSLDLPSIMSYISLLKNM